MFSGARYSTICIILSVGSPREFLFVAYLVHDGLHYEHDAFGPSTFDISVQDMRLTVSDLASANVQRWWR